jgi:hypothetical protein
MVLGSPKWSSILRFRLFRICIRMPAANPKPEAPLIFDPHSASDWRVKCK